MSVKRKVTVPLGSSAIAARSYCVVTKLTQFGRQAEEHVLPRDLDFLAFAEPELGQTVDHAVDEEVGRRCTRGQAYGLVALEPRLFEVALVVDQVGLGAARVRHLDEAVRVRARARTDDEHEGSLLADLLHRILP